MTTTIIAGLFGVFGVLVGVFAERLIQRYGKLRCEAVVWHSEAIGVAGTIEEKPSLPVDHSTFGAAGDITFFLRVDLFNEKERPTGLRDLAVVFLSEDGKEIKGPLMEDIVTDGSQPRPLEEDVRVVNLASGEWVRLDVKTGFLPEVLLKEGKNIEAYTRAELHGKFPSGRVYRAPIQFS